MINNKNQQNDRDGNNKKRNTRIKCENKIQTIKHKQTFIYQLVTIYRENKNKIQHIHHAEINE